MEKNSKLLKVLEEVHFRGNGTNTHKKILEMNEDISEWTNEVIEQNGRMLTPNKQKEKAFFEHYTKISSVNGKTQNLEVKRKISELTLEEFQGATKDLSNKKSPGPDPFVFFLKFLK